MKRFSRKQEATEQMVRCDVKEGVRNSRKAGRLLLLQLRFFLSELNDPNVTYASMLWGHAIVAWGHVRTD